MMGEARDAPPEISTFTSTLNSTLVGVMWRKWPITLSPVLLIIMSSMLPAEIKFSSPGNYRVRIVGDAFQKLWDYIEGEVEHVSTNKNGQVISTLKFHVRDQVELSGFIEVLFRRGFTLLSVERDDQI